MSWLLYGAYGYTGRLIVREAVGRGESPIVAGRREEPLRQVAERHGLPGRVFRLDDPVALDRGLENVDAVVLAAGPFSATSRPMIEACIRTGTHYLDITGEIPVFEAVFALDAEARDAGVTLVPGVGFDVVPTDCLAASLAGRLPQAETLVLAFASTGGGPSRGTAKTVVEGLAAGGAIRKDGRIRRVPLGWRATTIPFRDRPRLAVTIPWGDVSTAYRSTGIPNIAVLLAVPPAVPRALPLLRPLASLLRIDPVRRAVQDLLDRMVEGPDPEERRATRVRVWGRVTEPGGRSIEGWATTPDGYDFTAVSAVACVRRLLAEPVPGALTPALAFGTGLVAELPGCELEIGPVEGSLP